MENRIRKWREVGRGKFGKGVIERKIYCYTLHPSVWRRPSPSPPSLSAPPYIAIFTTPHSHTPPLIITTITITIHSNAHHLSLFFLPHHHPPPPITTITTRNNPHPFSPSTCTHHHIKVIFTIPHIQPFTISLPHTFHLSIFHLHYLSLSYQPQNLRSPPLLNQPFLLVTSKPIFSSHTQTLILITSQLIFYSTHPNPFLSLQPRNLFLSSLPQSVLSLSNLKPPSRIPYLTSPLLEQPQSYFSPLLNYNIFS